MKSDMQGRIGTVSFRLFLKKYKQQKLMLYKDIMMAFTMAQWITGIRSRFMPSIYFCSVRLCDYVMQV